MQRVIRFLLSLLLFISSIQVAGAAIDLGNRRELFVDTLLIEKLNGTERRLHHPIPQEVSIVHDAPWEGNISYYHTVFRDGDLYRMYYRGGHSGARTNHAEATGHQVVCYAESRDGRVWTKPDLGLNEFEGSKENNIIWMGIGVHNFVPFKDPNPSCQPEARYKAIGHGKGGLYVFQSADAIHWSLIADKPVITKGAFDSQNLAFYDAVRGRYVDFHRGFNKGVRAIMTCVSDDFLNWTEPEWIEYTDDRNEHLYTNQTIPYPRAPHIFMSFPKRFLPRRNPTLHRHTGVSDIVFMTSRDGRTFDRWGEAFLRPGLQRDRWVNRNNFFAWGIVETASGRAGVPDELSFYSVEGYYSGDDCQMRRFALRPDGFVSVNAPLSGGELITKPLAFSLPSKDVPRSAKDETPEAMAINSKNPISGAGSLKFDGAGILSIEGTKNLGKRVALAAKVRGVPAGHRRLFSTYNGGSTDPRELYFDFNAAGPISKKDGYSIRFNYDGVLVGVKFEDVGDWSKAKDAEAVHHLAATWDDGRVAIWFDGRKVGEGGKAGAGDLVFEQGDLRFGEDYPPTALSNEPFLGEVDDVLVLRRVLADEEVVALAGSSGMSLSAKEEKGVLLNIEDPGAPMADSLTGDGAQLVDAPTAARPGEVELRINFATSAAGSVRCEIQDEDGQPLPGFTLKDSDELYGDSLDRAMSWKGQRELKSLVGKPVRLRFVLKDADLYAVRFGR